MKAAVLGVLTLLLAEPGFHPPTTEAEKSLEALLRRSEKEDSRGFLLHLPGRKTSKDAAYLRLFTQPLRDSIWRGQKKELDRNCPGRQTPGEICGLEAVNVVICAQDANDVCLYRTESASPFEAVISYTWPDQPTVGTYSLIKDGNTWKLDGIHCRGAGGRGAGVTVRV